MKHLQSGACRQTHLLSLTNRRAETAQSEYKHEMSCSSLGREICLNGVPRVSIAAYFHVKAELCMQLPALCWFLNPEDGTDTLLRNVDLLSSAHKALCPRRLILLNHRCRTSYPLIIRGIVTSIAYDAHQSPRNLFAIDARIT
jgi:hypothetical protein